MGYSGLVCTGEEKFNALSSVGEGVSDYYGLSSSHADQELHQFIDGVIKKIVFDKDSCNYYVGKNEKIFKGVFLTQLNGMKKKLAARALLSESILNLMTVMSYTKKSDPATYRNLK